MLSKCIKLSLILYIVYIGRAVAASRRDNQTICDYYAEKVFGESNVATQLRLMQGIIAYAYAGGDTLPDPNPNSTGIFNKGKFNGYDVFLRPLFDGSSMEQLGIFQAKRLRYWRTNKVIRGDYKLSWPTSTDQLVRRRWSRPPPCLFKRLHGLC